MVRDVASIAPPPAYVEPANSRAFRSARPDRPIMPIGSDVPAPLYAAWRETLGDGIAAASLARGVRDVRAGDRTEAVPIRAVSANFFASLGVSLAMGQAPPPRSATARAPRQPCLVPHVAAAVRWRPNVLGQSIWVDNQPHTIVGVLPRASGSPT